LLAGYPFAAYFSDHGVAHARLSLMLFMFCTPSVSSHSRSAFAPPRTNTPTPSFQVARPQRTPQKWTPASEASASASLNARLLTPAERNKNGLSVAAAAFRKSSRASARVCTDAPEKSEEPST